MEWSVLYKKSKSKDAKTKEHKILKWQVIVELDEESGFPCIKTISGFVGGKDNISKRLVKKGTNVGRSNERTAMQQAEFVANRAWNAKVNEEKFVEDINDVHNVINDISSTFPMLAHKFDKSRVTFPCYVQPKLNGVRCVAYRSLGDERLLSRKSKEFVAIHHMKDEIAAIFGNYSPDGELYLHGVPLQTIVSWVKREQVDTMKLKYVVYDIVEPNMIYAERRDKIRELFAEYTKNYGEPLYCECLESTYISSMTELEEMYDIYINRGYEGLIYRSQNGLYKLNERVFNLMKYKNFVDSEFEIVDGIPEKYYDKLNKKFRELVIWVCKTESGRTFHVRPLGSADEKEKQYIERDRYIGKKLTIRYLELSTEGVPTGNPVGIAVRDYE